MDGFNLLNYYEFAFGGARDFDLSDGNRSALSLEDVLNNTDNAAARLLLDIMLQGMLNYLPFLAG